MQDASPIIFDFINEVENAKDTGSFEAVRAAIADGKKRGHDERMAKQATEEGATFEARTLHTRRAVGDREEVRDRDHAKYAEKTNSAEVTQSGQKASD